MPSDTLHVTGGRTKRTVHTGPECSRLDRANTVVEKPSAVIPDGFFDECDLCFGRVGENGDPVEAGSGRSRGGD